MAARSQPHPGQPCPAQPRGTFARPHPSLRNVHRISLPGSSSRPLRGVLAFPWGLGHFGHRGRVRPEKCRQKNTGKKIGEHGHGSSPHKQPASSFGKPPSVGAFTFGKLSSARPRVRCEGLTQAAFSQVCRSVLCQGTGPCFISHATLWASRVRHPSSAPALIVP